MSNPQISYFVGSCYKVYIFNKDTPDQTGYKGEFEGQCFSLLIFIGYFEKNESINAAVPPQLDLEPSQNLSDEDLNPTEEIDDGENSQAEEVNGFDEMEPEIGSDGDEDLLNNIVMTKGFGFDQAEEEKPKKRKGKAKKSKKKAKKPKKEKPVIEKIIIKTDLIEELSCPFITFRFALRKVDAIGANGVSVWQIDSITGATTKSNVTFSDLEKKLSFSFLYRTSNSANETQNIKDKMKKTLQALGGKKKKEPIFPEHVKHLDDRGKKFMEGYWKSSKYYILLSIFGKSITDELKDNERVKLIEGDLSARLTILRNIWPKIKLTNEMLMKLPEPAPMITTLNTDAKDNLEAIADMEMSGAVANRTIESEYTTFCDASSIVDELRMAVNHNHTSFLESRDEQKKWTHEVIALLRAERSITLSVTLQGSYYIEMSETTKLQKDIMDKLTKSNGYKEFFAVDNDTSDIYIETITEYIKKSWLENGDLEIIVPHAKRKNFFSNSFPRVTVKSFSDVTQLRTNKYFRSIIVDRCHDYGVVQFSKLISALDSCYQTLIFCGSTQCLSLKPVMKYSISWFFFCLLLVGTTIP